MPDFERPGIAFMILDRCVFWGRGPSVALVMLTDPRLKAENQLELRRTALQINGGEYEAQGSPSTRPRASPRCHFAGARHSLRGWGDMRESRSSPACGSVVRF